MTTKDPKPVELEAETVAATLRLPPRSVAAAIALLADGSTIPFIARYRKEATGGLDEVQLRTIEDELDRLRTLAARKKTVLQTIEQQGTLTPELQQRIEAVVDLASLELLYLPFKPRRRTRADAAREKGLQPLAERLMAGRGDGRTKDQWLAGFVDPANEVNSPAEALAGALDIVAEVWSQDVPTRQHLTGEARQNGRVVAKIKRGKKTDPAAEKFEQYFDRAEPVGRIPGHRVLAMLRGAEEGVLKVNLELDDDRQIAAMSRHFITEPTFAFAPELRTCVEDCYQRLLLPATESTILAELKAKADAEAIAVFEKNLRELLMAPPAGARATIGIDPGFRTGCKIAVVDGTGRYVDHATIYPTPPKSDTAGAGKTLLNLIAKHEVQLIAIGNGTASRETDAFVEEIIRQNDLSVTKAIVSESGASIYSASELAGREFPNLDVTIRGAISIARRLQDPLAELVKADPKTIGVGQYQHDVNQTLLQKGLDRVVESCVNHVGVDVNLASAPLLAHVAGIGPKLAEGIVAHRDQTGSFASRKELLKVPKLGKKAYEQSAGFLRIRGGTTPLDNSAVHPERYDVVQRMSKQTGIPIDVLVGNEAAAGKLDPAAFVDEDCGLPTVRDIIAELAKPGRDPRREFRTATFDRSVQSIDDVRVGMVLDGVITNVTHFGAFVDLGVHQDGLIHVSQLADRYVADPSEIVSVGDVVRVKVLEVDIERKRIAVSLKSS